MFALPKSPSAGAHAAREHRAPLGDFATIPTVLREFRVDPQALLAEVGVQLADFADPRRTISSRQADELLGACAIGTNCRHLGLLAGARVRVGDLGLAGRVAASGETVAQALLDLALVYHLQGTFGAPALAVHGGSAYLSYGLHASGFRNADQAYDFALAAMCGVMRELCGEDWHPDVVHLPRRAPPDRAPYAAVFRAPLVFDAPQAALVFPAAVLARRVPTGNAVVREALFDQARVSYLRGQPALVAQVRRTIRTQLEEGPCTRRCVAARLGMHERALSRRLQRADTTFQALLDEVRALLARELLCGTEATVAEIATTVGYRDSTVFGRAFRRWMGVTPRQFREDRADSGRRAGGGARHARPGR